MADENVSTEENTAISEETVEKAVNGEGGGAEKKPENDVEEKKVDTPAKVEMDPQLLAKKVKRQIEYYFGDFNLPTDKFLREQVKEKDGWVPLETMLKFKRLASLTQDPSVILSALTNSELIQISEDKTEIRRHPDKPLPEENEERRKAILARSVYVKGFPLEGFTIDNALDFFEQFGPTDDVVMRFYQDKATKTWKFKGSVFIKFPTKEAGAAFLALEEVKYGDTPLIRMWQEEYIEQKRKERLDQKMLKRKRPEDDNSSQKSMQQGLPKNATLKMTKCPDSLTREVVKEKIEELGVTVAFIDFNKGDEEGWIRLHEADTAPKVMEKCEDGVFKLTEDLEVHLNPLEGEEEETFLQNAKNDINARRAKGGRQQKGRRGGGRGGKGGHWRKRKHDNSADAPQAKAQKTEADSGDDGE